MRYFAIILCLVSFSSFSKSNYYRTFWMPSYANISLNWCEQKSTRCGKAVAQKYCNEMGYSNVTEVVKANDIGLSKYIDTKQKCKTPFCDGFAIIQCGNNTLNDTKYYSYYARKRVFAYPSIVGRRIDWCFKKGKQCGRRSAYAFCRYQGYSKAIKYSMDPNLSQTRTMGTRELCIGPGCKGYKSITCRRV